MSLTCVRLTQTQSQSEYYKPDFPIDLSIASPFSTSRQIAIGNAGPTSALESMGPKPTFGCHSLNIGLKYHSKGEKVVFQPPDVHEDNNF